MLAIRGPQLKALETEYRYGIVRDLAQNLRSSAPHAIEALTDAEVAFRVEAAVNGIVRYSLTSHPDMEAFTRLCFLIGPYFDRYDTFQRAFSAAGPGSGFSMTEVLFAATPEDWCRAAQADILARSQKRRGASSPALRLVTLTPAHAEAWFRGASHPDVWRLGNMQPPASLQAVREWLAETRAATSAASQRFALLTTPGDTFAGSARLWQVPEDGCFYLSYWVVRDLWGKGIATQAVNQMLDYLGQDNPLPVRLRIDSGNAPSLRVAEKCGFQLLTDLSGISLLERRDG